MKEGHFYSLTYIQGEVEIYGSHSELSERKIDTKQLLGLIQEKKREQDEFSYKGSGGENSIKDGEIVQFTVKKCIHVHIGYGFERMVSVEDPTSPRRRLVSYKSVEDDQVSIASDMSADSTANVNPSAVV